MLTCLRTSEPVVLNSRSIRRSISVSKMVPTTKAFCFTVFKGESTKSSGTRTGDGVGVTVPINTCDVVGVADEDAEGDTVGETETEILAVGDGGDMAEDAEGDAVAVGETEREILAVGDGDDVDI